MRHRTTTFSFTHRTFRRQPRTHRTDGFVSVAKVKIYVLNIGTTTCGHHGAVRAMHYWWTRIATTVIAYCTLPDLRVPFRRVRDAVNGA